MGIVLNWSPTAFPVALDSVAGSYPPLTDGVHDIMSSHPVQLASAVHALEAKVGINNSAVTTSFDFMLKQGRLTSQQPGGGVGSIAFLLDTTNAHSGADSLLSFRSATVERFRLGGGAVNDLYIEMGGGSTAAVSALSKGRLIYNQATNKWQISENGGAYVDFAGTTTLNTAYINGNTITTTLADGAVAVTRGGLGILAGTQLLTLNDADASTGRTAALLDVTDANVGTAVAGRFSRSSINGAALRAERTGAGDAVWESGLIAGSTITARIFGDGRAIFGGSAAVGAERVRVTGGTTMFDFTSTTALTVAQTGGGDPTLIVDTTNKRVGIGAAPGAFSLDVTGPTRINGKLTVTGGIDPTFLELNAGVGNNAYIECTAGQAAGLSLASRGRIIFNAVTNRWQVSENGGAYTNIVTGAGGADSLQTAYDTGSTITTDATGVVGVTRGLGHPAGAGSQLLTLNDANVVINRTLALLDISDTNVFPGADPDVPSLRITRSQTSGQVAIHLARTGTATGPGFQAPSSKLQLSASIWDGAAAQTRTYSLLNSVTVAAESATNVAARVTLMHGTTSMVDFYPRDLAGATATLVISPRAPAGVVPALTLRAQGAYGTNGPLFSVENADNANNQIMNLAVGALDLKVQENVAIGYRLNLALVKNLGAGIGVDNDECGSVYFQGPDDAGTLRDIAQVRGATMTAAAATLRGRLELYAATQGALNVLLAEVMGDTAGAAATRAGLIVRSRVTAASGAIPFTLRAEANIAAGSAVLRVQKTDGVTGILSVMGDGLTMNASRLRFAKGADVASAADITLGSDGNVFTITGIVNISTILATNWQAGSVVVLIGAAAAVFSVNHNTAGVGARVFLSGGVAFSMVANSTLTLCYDGTQWQETGRKAA